MEQYVRATLYENTGAENTVVTTRKAHKGGGLGCPEPRVQKNQFGAHHEHTGVKVTFHDQNKWLRPREPASSIAPRLLTF